MTDRLPEPDRRIVWPPGHEPASAVVFTQNATDIAATPETVWASIVDAAAWPGWYRHASEATILRGGATIAEGGKFRFKTLGFFFEPDVRTFEPHRALVWSARGPAGTSGAHAWYLEPTPAGCRVVTEETQKGFLLTLTRARATKTLLAAHDEWLRALKERAEAASA